LDVIYKWARVPLFPWEKRHPALSSFMNQTSRSGQF
jgi:hypothetical protein